MARLVVAGNAHRSWIRNTTAARPTYSCPVERAGLRTGTLNRWIVFFTALLCVVTVVHVVHAMAAAWWVFRWGEGWHRAYLNVEASVADNPETDTPERIRLYDDYHGANWLRFFGVKSYRLEKWALDGGRPRRWALNVARFGWKWNFFPPGVSLLILATSISGLALPAVARDLLWITAMATVVGMATIAIEGLVATITFGSWAEYHHRWPRRLVSAASPASIDHRLDYCRRRVVRRVCLTCVVPGVLAAFPPGLVSARTITGHLLGAGRADSSRRSAPQPSRPS